MKIQFLLITAIAIDLATVQANDTTSCGNNTDPCRECQGDGNTDNSIDTYTGNEKRFIDDLEVWGGVGEHQLVWRRYANSRFTNTVTTFGNGNNWRHSYQWEMSVATTDVYGPYKIEIYYPTGAHNSFYRTVSPGSTYESTPNISDILTLNAAQDTFTLQQADGFQYIFSKVVVVGVTRWRLSQFLDTQQNVYSFTYNSSNQLTRITEPGGRYLSITYAVLTYNNINDSQFGKIATPTAGWNTIISTHPTTAYRYLRYMGEHNKPTIAAEIEFLDASNNVLSGTPFSSGAPQTPGQDYTKAFDSDTSTAFSSALQVGDYVGFDLGTPQAVSSIRFYPPNGNPLAMKNGNFFGTNQAPASITVITQVQSSDGRSVTYHYSPFADSGLPYTWQVLSSVNYGDGTSATYSYGQNYPGTRPLLTEAADPRVPTAGTHLKWTYAAGDTHIVGYVKDESNGVTGMSVVSFTAAGQAKPVAHYSNGGVVTWTDSENTALVNSKADSLGRIFSYTYDAAGYGFLLSFKDALNRTTNWTKSLYNNPLSQTNPDGSSESWTRDSLDLVLTHTDELGRVTTYTRDGQHRVTRIDYPDTSYETFSYNGFGEVLSHRLRNGGTETNTYDARGLKASETDAEGNVTTYTYDSHDLRASATDPRNLTTSYEYNERGLLTKTTYPDGGTVAYGYDNFGNRTAVTNELGHTWTTVYDEWRRPISITDPLSRAISYNYDLPGGICGCGHSEELPTKITLPSGKMTVIAYDTEWQRTSVTVGAGTADAATTQYGYDLVGNLTSITDPRGKVWQFTYDTRHRRLTRKDPLNPTTQYGYDAVGNMLTETRPDTGIITNVYDSMNRLTQSTDSKSQVTQFGYDAGGNMVSLTDARSNAYGYDYDRLNRRTKVTYPDSSYEQWTYNDAADTSTPMLIYRGRDGSTMSCLYSNRNWETLCDFSDATTPDISMSYDVAGRLISRSTSVAASTYTYDDANQYLSETQTPTALGTGFTVGYAYDADGNRSSLTYPDGAVVDYTYTSRNQLKEVTAGGPSPLASFTYDLNDKRSSRALKNSTSTSYAYDNASRLTEIKHVKGTAVLAQFDYTLDAMGNRTQKAATGVVPNRTENYGYDAVDQLASANYGSRNEAFNYDAVGNRTGVVDSVTGTIGYNTNNLNQYSSVGAVAPTYDTNGNLAGYGSWSYGYDSKNRLLNAADGTSTATFTYDGRNRQVSRTINGTTTYFVYDEWDLIAEYDAAGALMQKYIRGPDDDELLAKIDSTGTIYYHQDGLGSTVALTDGTGALLESYEYDAFGKPDIYDGSGTAIAASAYANRFLFTGREWLSDIGLYDYRNRVYSPELGRFLQTDPIRNEHGEDLNPWIPLLGATGSKLIPSKFDYLAFPVSRTDENSKLNTVSDAFSELLCIEQNLYTLAFNAPTDFVDPDGWKPKPPNGKKPCGHDSYSGSAEDNTGPGKILDNKCSIPPFLFPIGILNHCPKEKNCCKKHDRCYLDNGCSSGSWFPWCGTQACHSCNAQVVRCILGGGTNAP